jgi:hypothetical protein
MEKEIELEKDPCQYLLPVFAALQKNNIIMQTKAAERERARTRTCEL